MADRAAEYQGSLMIGVVVFLLIFTTIFVVLRFYTRTVLTHSLWWDDWTTLAAFVCTIADGIVMCIHNSHGQGRHVATLDEAGVRGFYKVLYVSIVIYYTGLGIVKTAILLQYYRIFTVKMRKVTIWTIVIIGMWSLSLVLVSIFMCRPIAGFWDKRLNPECISYLLQWYINAGGNIATDLVIFFLPIPVLWKLHLPLSQRVSLIGVFALGFFTCAISALRITFLDNQDDMSYKNIGPAGWSLGELCCAIIGSCLPTLRPVLARVFPSVFGSRDARTRPRPSGFTSYGGGYAGRYTCSQSGPLVRPVEKSRPASSTDELTCGRGGYEMAIGVATSAGLEKMYGVMGESDATSSESVMGLGGAREHLAQTDVPRQPSPAKLVKSARTLEVLEGDETVHAGVDRRGPYTTIQATGGRVRSGSMSGIQVQTDLVTVVQQQQQQ